MAVALNSDFAGNYRRATVTKVVVVNGLENDVLGQDERICPRPSITATNGRIGVGGSNGIHQGTVFAIHHDVGGGTRHVDVGQPAKG